MIANLIDNGIRHNERGGQLSVRTERENGSVRLIVANGGAVIDAAEAQRLFEPFRRLHRSVEGFGLGLSIVKSVVVAHHGTIEVIAPNEGGLELRITLPASSPASSVGAPLSAAMLTRS
jgi:signal transduction histidine kinase